MSEFDMNMKKLKLTVRWFAEDLFIISSNSNLFFFVFGSLFRHNCGIPKQKNKRHWPNFASRNYRKIMSWFNNDKISILTQNIKFSFCPSFFLSIFQFASVCRYTSCIDIWFLASFNTETHENILAVVYTRSSKSILWSSILINYSRWSTSIRLSTSDDRKRSKSYIIPLILNNMFHSGLVPSATHHCWSIFLLCKFNRLSTSKSLPWLSSKFDS